MPPFAARGLEVRVRPTYRVTGREGPRQGGIELLLFVAGVCRATASLFAKGLGSFGADVAIRLVIVGELGA